MRSLAIALVGVILLSSLARADDPRLLGNKDLSQVPAGDIPAPTDGKIMGYRFWPTVVTPVLLGPVSGIPKNGAPDRQVKHKTITGSRTLTFYYAANDAEQIALIRQYETVIQDLGGAIGYQCDGEACGVPGSSVGLACGWVVGWFINRQTDALNLPLGATKGVNLGLFQQTADNTGFWDNRAPNTPALPR